MGQYQLICTLGGLVGCATPNPESIQVRMHGRPTVAVEQMDDGAWLPSSPVETDFGDYIYEFKLGRSDTSITVVCAQGLAHYATQLHVTADDADVVASGWFPPSCDPVADATLTGSVLAADSEETYVVTRSPSFISTYTELFPFSFDMSDGFRDVAVYNQNRLLLLHNIDLVTTPMQDLGKLELGNAPPLETGNYGFDPADSDETVTAESGVTTVNGTGFGWATAPGTFLEPDDTTLIDGDVKWAYVVANSPTSTRSVNFDLGATVPSQISWLPRISDVQFDLTTSTASFTEPSFEHDLVRLDCSTSLFDDAEVVASKAWLASHARGSLSFDQSIPGWDPSWTSTTPGCELAFERRYSALSFSSTSLKSN